MFSIVFPFSLRFSVVFLEVFGGFPLFPGFFFRTTLRNAEDATDLASRDGLLRWKLLAEEAQAVVSSRAIHWGFLLLNFQEELLQPKPHPKRPELQLPPA